MSFIDRAYKSVALCCLALFSSTLYATELQPLDDIKAAAKQLVEQDSSSTAYRTAIDVGRLDPRLRLSKCASPLQSRHLNENRRGANTTVVVSCVGDKPWTVYVPVKVSRSVLVAVLQTPVGRSQTIQKEHIKFIDYDVSRLSNGFYNTAEAIIGRQARRNLIAGAVITPNDLLASRLISRGQRVTIITSNSAFSVRMPGKALADAAKGEIVKVENLSSRRTVEGIAINSSTVQITM